MGVVRLCLVLADQFDSASEVLGAGEVCQPGIRLVVVGGGRSQSLLVDYGCDLVDHRPGLASGLRAPE